MNGFHGTKWRCLHFACACREWVRNPFFVCAFASPLTQYKTLTQKLTQTHTQTLRVNKAQALSEVEYILLDVRCSNRDRPLPDTQYTPPPPVNFVQFSKKNGEIICLHLPLVWEIMDPPLRQTFAFIFATQLWKSPYQKNKHDCFRKINLVTVFYRKQDVKTF